MSTYNPDKLPTPYDYGLDPHKWNGFPAQLRFTSLTQLKLTANNKFPTTDYEVSYPIGIGYDVPEWPTLLSQLEKIVKNDLPLKGIITDDNIEVFIDIYNPYHDMAHPDTLWIELRGVQTQGLRGQEDFQFKISRSKLLEDLFTSLDEVLKNSDDELLADRYFDNEKYEQLKSEFITTTNPKNQ